MAPIRTIRATLARPQDARSGSTKQTGAVVRCMSYRDDLPARGSPTRQRSTGPPIMPAAQRKLRPARGPRINLP